MHAFRRWACCRATLWLTRARCSASLRKLAILFFLKRVECEKLALGAKHTDPLGTQSYTNITPRALPVAALGLQFISLIQSEEIASITSVGAVENINLDGFDALQDTVNVVFTKQYGFRLSSVDYKTIVPRVCVAEVDFYEDNPGSLPLEKRIHVTCEKSGTIHCVMLFWEAYADRERTQVMSTDPEATRDNFPRDMQWGQALQVGALSLPSCACVMRCARGQLSLLAPTQRVWVCSRFISTGCMGRAAGFIWGGLLIWAACVPTCLPVSPTFLTMRLCLSACMLAVCGCVTTRPTRLAVGGRRIQKRNTTGASGCQGRRRA